MKRILIATATLVTATLLQAAPQSTTTGQPATQPGTHQKHKGGGKHKGQHHGTHGGDHTNHGGTGSGKQ